MRWRKLGRVYVAGGEASWAQNRAYLPTSIALDSERIRVFAAFLDDQNVGRIGFVDVHANDPKRVLKVSRVPALDIGEPGMFDDSGVSPLTVFRHGGEIWMYYIGWQRSERVPYFMFTGLARSHDGESFARHSNVPVLDRTDAEPTLRSGTFVSPSDAGFRAWYMTGREWGESDGRLRPRYHMRYIESEDGISWPPEGTPCLEPEAPDEYGFGRPYVIREDGRYRMWYSIRTHSRGYRLGYAESPDGIAWTRCDNRAGLDVSPSGWDSQMVFGGWIQEAQAGRYLFYNGNGYGESGFGVAVADADGH
jgi:hypothetical protein